MQPSNQGQNEPAQPVQNEYPIKDTPVAPNGYSAQPYIGAADPAPLPKKRRFTKKVLLIIVIILVLVGSGGGYAYWVTLNNRPEKVLADALSNTMSNLLERRPTTTVGSLTYESKGQEPYTVTIDFDAKQANDDFETGATLRFEGYDTDITVNGGLIIMDTNEAFVKFENISETVGGVTAINPEIKPLTDALQPLIQKIDGQWIRIDSEGAAETGLAGSEEDINACSEAVKNLRIREEDKGNIKDIFNRNQFAIATEKLPKEEASGEESFHYKLDLNERTSVKFAKELIELKSFEAVKKDCEIEQKELDEELKNISVDEDVSEKPVIELWVGTETRLPTRLHIGTHDKELTTTFDTTIKINASNVSIKAPEDAIPLQELLDDIEAVFQTVNDQPIE